MPLILTRATVNDFTVVSEVRYSTCTRLKLLESLLLSSSFFLLSEGRTNQQVQYLEAKKKCKIVTIRTGKNRTRNLSMPSPTFWPLGHAIPRNCTTVNCAHDIIYYRGFIDLFIDFIIPKWKLEAALPRQGYTSHNSSAVLCACGVGYVLQFACCGAMEIVRHSFCQESREYFTYSCSI